MPSGAGHSHPCAPVNGNVPEMAVRGHSDFEPVNVNAHPRRNPFGNRIHEQNAALHLVSNEKKIVRARVTKDAAWK